MCCHTSSNAKAIFSALSALDPNIGTGRKWVHDDKKHDKGRKPGQFADATEALDAAIQRAQSGSYFTSLTPEERIAAYKEIVTLREKLATGEIEIPTAIGNALGRYATPSLIDRIKNEKKALGVGVAMLAAGAAIALPLSTASTTQAKGPIKASIANSAFPHAKVSTKGKCPTGFTLAKATATHRVMMVNGKKMTLKKGGAICINLKPKNTIGGTVAGSNGAAAKPSKTYVPVVDSSGRNFLPSNFPAEGQATIADIQSLGWSPSTIVSKSAVLPEPVDSLAPGVAPTRIVWQGDEDGTAKDGTPITFSTFLVEGGSGLIKYRDGSTYVLKELGGTTTIRIAAASGSLAINKLPISCMANKGQASLPSSTWQTWSTVECPPPTFP